MLVCNYNPRQSIAILCISVGFCCLLSWTSDFIDLGHFSFHLWIWVTFYRFCFFSKNHFLLTFFFKSLFHFISALIFHDFFSFSLLWVCSSFPSSFGFRVWYFTFTWDFLFFFKSAFIAGKFPLRTTFAAFHKFQRVELSFISREFLISYLIPW